MKNALEVIGGAIIALAVFVIAFLVEGWFAMIIWNHCLAESWGLALIDFSQGLDIVLVLNFISSFFKRDISLTKKNKD